MEADASLKQTVTHLFDAIRYSNHAKELEQAAVESEDRLQVEVSKLETSSEEMSHLISSMKEKEEGPLKDFSTQLEGFLEAAKEQAREKLQGKATDATERLKKDALSERDRALKSLEAYLASDPLPVLDETVRVELVEGEYEARSSYECEGGVKYEFVLAAKNSKMFHQEATLAQLGHELKVPVRFSKALLKGRVPGFERLDQYALSDAEESGGKLHATFVRSGNGSKIKVVTSGKDDDAFIGLEFVDKVQSVNIMNDASLSGHVDVPAVKSALKDVVGELEELAGKRVSLTKASLGGEDLLATVDCYGLAQVVFEILGPRYREEVHRLSESPVEKKENGGLSLQFIRERIRILGAQARPVSQSLGLLSQELP